MKVNGKSVQPPEPSVVVIPRGGEEYVFMAKAVTDYAECDRVCPEPKPPGRVLPGGTQVTDTSSPEYQKARREWLINRSHWLILKSLSATEGLEWAKVDMEKPETWKEYISELEAAGFSGLEVTALVDAVHDANGLNQRKIDEATKRFLATRRDQATSAATPDSEPTSMQSGKPVSASA